MNIKKIARSTGVAFLAIAAGAAQAQTTGTGGDLSALTGSISFAEVGVAIMAVAAAIIAFHVLKKGALEVIAFMRRA